MLLLSSDGLPSGLAPRDEVYMSNSSGFFYLNTANEWPLFELHDLEISSDGSMILVQVDDTFLPRGVTQPVT